MLLSLARPPEPPTPPGCRPLGRRSRRDGRIGLPRRGRQAVSRRFARHDLHARRSGEPGKNMLHIVGNGVEFLGDVPGSPRLRTQSTEDIPFEARIDRRTAAILDPLFNTAPDDPVPPDDEMRLTTGIAPN